MAEYANRTHQKGQPRLAREYLPPVIDQAAMPIRVELWRDSTGLFYRIVGVMWGGAPQPTNAADSLELQLDPTEGFRPVERPGSGGGTTWTLWSHLWRPKKPGTYTLKLRFDDPKISTRRLDQGYYQRKIMVRDV